MSHPADEFSIEYEFEVSLSGDGLIAAGTATLSDAGAGYEGEFYVSEITFKNGASLSPSSVGFIGQISEKALFRTLTRIIEADRDAEASYAAAYLAQYPHVYSAMAAE